MILKRFIPSAPCPAVAAPARLPARSRNSASAKAGRRLVARALVVAVFLVVALGGCYLPLRFDAEVKIMRGGYYEMDFDGYLVWLPLYEGLRTGKISPAEEEEKVERLMVDLTRDTAITDTSYFKLGRFRVRWKKSGDLLRVKSVTFLRRNEIFIGIKYVKRTGLITLRGADVGKSARKRLVAMGLDSVGELRVKTDLPIVEHNATTITGGKQKLLTWKIKSLFDPSPKLVLKLR